MTSKQALNEAIKIMEEISKIPENPDGTVLLPTSIQVNIGLLLGKIQPNFICKGCQCEVPYSFSLRTKGYCYLCDPNITIQELLSDKMINKL